MNAESRRPGPVGRHWSWQLHAACRELGSGLFFHPSGERGDAADRRERAAKGVCARCPVRDACLSHALAAREPFGVWGGLNEQERQTLLRRERARGRRAVAS